MSLALAEELHRLEEQGSTGVLRAGDGEFHLARGAIASAGCRRTIGLDRLVVEAGVATAEDWRRAGAGDPGPLLHRPRLETLALLSVFDAAYFLLASAAEPEFLPAPEHWLAPVCRVAPHTLLHECARRSDSEWGPWPADLVAAVPVVPARRVRRHRVVLTGGQAEVLAAADERRSIAEIARDLGRTTYGCLVAVRDLTTAGLIQEPDPAAAEPVVAPAVADAPQSSPAVRHLTLAPAPVEDTGRHRHSAPEVPSTGVPALPRRVPPALGGGGTARPPRPVYAGTGERTGRHAVDEEATAPARHRGHRTGAAPYEPERWRQVDRDVLIRLRAALEELA